jgi:hypothetical protein
LRTELANVIADAYRYRRLSQERAPLENVGTVKGFSAELLKKIEHQLASRRSS